MGNFHQASPEIFSHDAAGAQCSSISVVANIAAQVESPMNWTPNDIDSITRQGDIVHRRILTSKFWPEIREEPKLALDSN